MRKVRVLAVVAVVAVAVAGVPGGAAAESANEQRLRRLEETLRKQQAEIEELHKALKQQSAIGQATQKQAEQAAEGAEAAKTASAEAVKKTPDWLSKMTIFGEVRARHEGFYHQRTTKGTPVGARNRERVRMRLGFRYALNDEISATIRAASGNINEVTGQNDTLSGNFNRKNFNLDWAYLTFAPGKTFGWRPGVASFTAGKFAMPQFKVSELIFDEELSPEGFAETFQLLGQPWGNVDQVKVHALQLTFAELSNAQDGWIFGGQINPSFHFGNLQLEAGLGQFWWLNPDLIAMSLSKNTTSYTSSGAPVANSGYNSSLVNTNLLVNETIQPPASGGKTPASFSAITGYQSAFNETNLSVGGTVPNVVAAQPLRVFFDYVYNWQAFNHDDANGAQVGMKLGQTKTRGDWAVTALYEYLQQEAVISSFSWSDIGYGGTNVQGPVFSLEHQLLNPLTVSATTYLTNLLDAPPEQKNETTVRVQLNALVRF